MSHWNLLVTTVRFIKTITLIILGLLLGGGGGAVCGGSFIPILVNEALSNTEVFMLALTRSQWLWSGIDCMCAWQLVFLFKQEKQTC